MKQTGVKSYPLEITKTSDSSQTNYTFIWKAQAYLAIVDLNTHKFKVLAVKMNNQGTNTQNKVAARASNGQASGSAKSGTSQLLNYIDKDIKNKYFPSENVKCIKYKQTSKGYYMIYQRSNGKQINFDVTVTNQNGNTVINFKILTQSSPVIKNDNNNGKNQVPQQPVKPPMAGSYREVSEPAKNANVVAILKFLFNSYSRMIQYSRLLKA